MLYTNPTKIKHPFSFIICLKHKFTEKPILFSTKNFVYHKTALSSLYVEDVCSEATQNTYKEEMSSIQRTFYSYPTVGYMHHMKSVLFNLDDSHLPWYLGNRFLYIDSLILVVKNVVDAKQVALFINFFDDFNNSQKLESDIKSVNKLDT